MRGSDRAHSESNADFVVMTDMSSSMKEGDVAVSENAAVAVILVLASIGILYWTTAAIKAALPLFTGRESLWQFLVKRVG